ncbi:MAG: nonstructural protein [Microviridae sp.]|nr:MAG: nonstructural protein [Microviridae sp.]
MILKLFSVYDRKAKILCKPFYADNAVQAQRIFNQAVNEPGSQYSRWPADFELVEIGSWSDDSHVVTSHVAPLSLGLAVDYVVSAAPATTVNLEPRTAEV